VPGELSVDAAQTEVARIEALLEERFGIRHTTLQLECRPCTMPAHD
jgi:Co/Zn/Cd efflux system component